MDKIQQQEQKLQELRKRWVEASPGYRKFIEQAGKLERWKLESMKKRKEESDKNAADPLL